MIFQAIKQRVCASLLAPPLSEYDLQRASQLAADLPSDGSWGDPAESGLEPTNPEGEPEHLQRTLLLARANQHRNGEFDQPLLRALDFWLAYDFEAPTWRQNLLVVPRLIGSIAILSDEGLSPGARGKVMEILARSRWQQWLPGTGWADWTGTILLQVAYNAVLRGCLFDTTAAFDEAFARVFGAIHVAADGEDGIQADMIYHDSQSFRAGNDEGLLYATECARFVALAHGTPWQAPAEATKLLATFLLNGQQWLMRHGAVDSQATARDGEPGRVNREELAAVVERLSQFADTPRRSELAALSRRLVGRGETLAGHRHFWRSGFSVHQRPAFYSSVRLTGGRAGSNQAIPMSDRQRSASTAGMVSVMRSGHEYDDMDRHAPEGGPSGTTFLRGRGVPEGEMPLAKDPMLPMGGVSEGDYGVAALQSNQDGIRTTKAWYYFDHSFVCLGAGIATDGLEGRVFTSASHCRLNGPVGVTSGEESPRILTQTGQYDLAGIRRVTHDGITYEFLRSTNLVARLEKPGEDGTTTPDTTGQFALWLDHGAHPQEATYAYMVLPLGDEAIAKVKIDEEVSQVEILSNTPALQAVRHRGLRLMGFTFWQAGLVTLPDGGRVAANQPCVLLCRDTPSVGKRLSIANLRGEATTVHVEYAGRCLCFELPGGPDAGRGISRSL